MLTFLLQFPGSFYAYPSLDLTSDWVFLCHDIQDRSVATSTYAGLTTVYTRPASQPAIFHFLTITRHLRVDMHASVRTRVRHDTTKPGFVAQGQVMPKQSSYQISIMPNR
ncbi:hypothetical protein MY8738_004961 [Beauveria namnaoensis]